MPKLLHLFSQADCSECLKCNKDPCNEWNDSCFSICTLQSTLFGLIVLHWWMKNSHRHALALMWCLMQRLSSWINKEMAGYNTVISSHLGWWPSSLWPGSWLNTSTLLAMVIVHWFLWQASQSNLSLSDFQVSTTKLTWEIRAQKKLPSLTMVPSRRSPAPAKPHIIFKIHTSTVQLFWHRMLLSCQAKTTHRGFKQDWSWPCTWPNTSASCARCNFLAACLSSHISDKAPCNTITTLLH